jgi:hypothetical protein
MYTPNGGWGLLGGVWVAVSFWYAFAAAKYAPEFMAHALSISFQNYSSDPRRNNTVPGQFSEWLHGETLVNEGMMLSPWFPPRYLWAAIEGVAGLDISGSDIEVSPRLAPDWKWMAVQNLPHQGKRLTWLAVRIPEVTVYTNFLCPMDVNRTVVYEEDFTRNLEATGESICLTGFHQQGNLLLFAGNTSERSVNTAIRVRCRLQGAYRLRTYDSLLRGWTEHDGLLSGEDLKRGVMLTIERRGFSLLDLHQEV